MWLELDVGWPPLADSVIKYHNVSGVWFRYMETDPVVLFDLGTWKLTLMTLVASVVP